jgi:hypothetical protein
MHGIILTDGRKTVSQIRRSTHEKRALSCMIRFHNESPWCTKNVTQKRIEFIREQIKKTRVKMGDSRPITFFIIDDTQSKRDRSTTHMEGLDNHFSHSDGKAVWSHCVVTAHIVCDDYSYTWDFRSYFREPFCKEHGLLFKSKNDLAIDLINTFNLQRMSWYMY